MPTTARARIQPVAPSTATAREPHSAPAQATRTRPRQDFSVRLLLVLLAVLPATLLGGGIWGSRAAARLASDINRSGSLRFRSLYIYQAGQVAREKKGKRIAVDGSAREQYDAMRAIMADLRQRYPDAVARTDDAWAAFSREMDHDNAVDWKTADKMRLSADRLTSILDGMAQWDDQQTTTLFAFGIGLLILAVPWTLIQSNHLRDAEAQNQRQTLDLAQLSERYTNLFDNVPVACFVYDTEGRIVDWNHNAEELFGQPRDAVLGKFLWEAVSRRERWEAAKETVALVLSGESLTGLEWTRPRADGTPAALISSVYPLRDAHGAVTGGVSVTADITERRRAEKDQRRLIVDIAASEQRLRNVTSRSHSVLWEAKVTEMAFPGHEGPFWNEERRTMLSWDTHVLHEEEVYRWLPFTRRNDESFLNAWRASIPPDDAALMDANSNRALREHLPRYTQEYRCRLADGTVRWLLENVDVSETTEGRFELVGICTDITLQKEAEGRLRAVAEDLERSNRSLTEFASIASHDLKEPLRKIRTFGDMLRRRAGDSLPAEAAGYLERMTNSAERMQALIDGLLDYSRAARKPRAPRPIDLNEIVQGVLGDLEVPIFRSAARVHVSALPTLHADPLQMRQLMQNLISNALKFHRRGQPPLIDIHTELPPDSSDVVQIVVADQGIGFNPKYVDRIFDMFEQLEITSSDYEGAGDTGTGVGLAICRKIAERHGGSIHAESTPGAGSRFIVTLPLGGSWREEP